ncbi:hypothetical protein AB0H43_26885 [Hamadaea sp. NPDC050747]
MNREENLRASHVWPHDVGSPALLGSDGRLTGQYRPDDVWTDQ